MKTCTRRYLGLFIIIAFTAMPGWGGACEARTGESNVIHLLYPDSTGEHDVDGKGF
jgi:hypothetical protein